jgi:hypothetical protein
VDGKSIDSGKQHYWKKTCWKAKEKMVYYIGNRQYRDSGSEKQ